MNCEICYQFFDSIEELQIHTINCLEEQTQSISKFETIKKDCEDVELSDVQKSAYEYAKTKSQIHSKKIKFQILERFNSLGYIESDIKKSISYLKNDVQIIIHFRSNLLNQIVDDGYYRNRYELDANFDRSGWENNLFNKIYDGCPKKEKVKYGTLNVLNDNKGVFSAYGYGDSYFVLKKEVNKRSTFVMGDSSGGQFHIATFKYPNIILFLVPNDLLREIINHADGKPVNYAIQFPYIEAQIHGDIKICRDIEKIMINKNHIHDHSIRNTLKKLNEKYNVAYEYF